MNDLITIIVPVYNTEKYLKKCLDSLVNQEYNNLEIIIVDDGSKDYSGQICDEYAAEDHRILVVHKENSGQGIARNVALDMAHGSYIGFVDSDDYIDPQMFSILYQALKEHNADMAFCGVMNDHVFVKKKCPMIDHLCLYNRNELFVSYLTEPYVRGILCNKLFKAKLFENIRFSSLRAREDADILYRVYGRCQKSVYIPQALYTQLVRPGSTEQSAFNDSKLYTVHIFENLGNYIIENIPDIQVYAELLKAQGIGSVLAGIAAAENFGEYKQTYENLLLQLQHELLIHDNHDSVNDKLYDDLADIVKNQKKFLKKGKRRFRKNKVLKMIKKALNG